MIYLSIRPTSSRPKRPEWLRTKVVNDVNFEQVSNLVRKYGLHTVCEEAACPNIFVCYGARTATFLILGNKCTRNCRFCQIKPGRGEPVDYGEADRIAEATILLNLKHVVITSVTRDDLADGGAAAFAMTVGAVKRAKRDCQVEVLIPDFQGNERALRTVAAAKPDILAHNLETASSLYPTVRPQANYRRSLNMIFQAKELGMKTKSGIMVGLGESFQEIVGLMNDLRAAGAHIFTVGQYLQPTPDHLPVFRFYSPEEFEVLGKIAYSLGFEEVRSGPLVRSSYREP